MKEYIKVEQGKCHACRLCEMACIAAHHGITTKEARKRRDEFDSRMQVLKTDEYKTPMCCRRCDPAPCCAVCPTGALRQSDGKMTVHEELCMNCKMCVAVCPYGAVTTRVIGIPDLAAENGESAGLRERREIAVCDLCEKWRKANGKEFTACLEVCSTGALSLVRADGTILSPPPKPAREKDAGDGAAPKPVTEPAPKLETEAKDAEAKAPPPKTAAKAAAAKSAGA